MNFLLDLGLTLKQGPCWANSDTGGRTPGNIAAVMELYPVGERFFQEFTLRQVLLNAAKNGSGPSAAGTSSRAEGPNTAEPVATTASPAPGANSEPTDSAAPIESTP